MRIRRVGLVFAAAATFAAAVCLSPSREAAAGDAPSKRYRDRNAKFSFRIFDDWDMVPVETESKDAGSGLVFGGSTQKFCVAQFSQTGAMKRDKWAGWCRAFRMGNGMAGFRSGAETTGDGTAPDPFLEKLKKEMGADDPKSMKELFDKTLEGYGFSGFLDPKAAKTIKSKDGVEGQMWIVERKYERGFEDKPFFHVFACWKQNEMELGLWLHCGPDQKKKFEQGFPMVAKSFMFFDPQAEDVKKVDALDGLPMTRRRRNEIERGLVQGWDVLVSKNRNYVIVYNTANGKNKLLAKVIADRIEAIREQVYERIFPPAAKIESVSIVRICKDQEEYFKYGGPGGSAGYWSDDTEELVFYDASPAKLPDDDTVAVLYHEAFHQYIYYSVGEVAPHSWFNEGTGDYFAGARYSGGKFTIKPFNWRVETIHKAIRTGPVPVEIKKDEDGDVKLHFDWTVEGYIPLEAFVQMSQREYYGPLIGNCYAQGWSFNYFLREAVPKNPKWNEKWGKILSTYFDTLKAEVNKDKPLAPKKVKPDDDPGMDDPGMDDPGMGDGGTNPGMDDPGMDGDPGMGDGGMGDGGMGDGGMGDGSGDGTPPDQPPENFIPKSFSRFSNSERALRRAVEEAFKGVDFAELEKAWKDYTLRVH